MKQWDQFLIRAFRDGDIGLAQDIYRLRVRRAVALAQTLEAEPVAGLRQFLNLDRSEDRRARFIQRASVAGMKMRRQVAVDAAQPDFDPSTRVLWAPAGPKREAAMRKPANLACFLGHRAMWIHLIDSGAPLAAIYEDDAEPLGDPLRYLARFPPPADWDVIYFSERAEPMDDLGGAYAPLPKAFSSHFRRADVLHYVVAPGTDSYLVSRRGAERLLALFSQVGLPVALDYVILRNALSSAVVTGDARYDELYNAAVDGRSARASAPVLNAYATTAALSEVGDFPSIMAPMRRKIDGAQTPEKG